MTEHRLSGLIELLSARRLLTAPPLLAGEVADVDPRIGAVRYDSRQVRADDLFVARPGRHSDGHDHLAAAVAAGAVAVIVERPALRLGVPQLVTPDARAALGIAAAWAAADPSQALGIVGITGTDGKTTTAYLVRTILEAAGEPTGLVGTTDVIAGGVGSGNPARTSTPEAPELQAALAAMRAAGDRWAVLESSSHGLAQQRVSGVAYDVAVLTNITSEHLEFHGTLEAYRAAKRSLFSRLAVSAENPEKGWGKHAVVNADDPTAESMAAAAMAAGARVWRYGFSGELGARSADELDVTASGLLETPAGMRMQLNAGAWSGVCHLRLAGRFNVANALAALGVARALGLDLDTAASALGRLGSVPGRMQRVDEGQPFTLVIDYAHTADALAKVLDELAPADPANGLIAVFGSAGDRDPTKREPMGRVAGERCRLVVITDEDPRTEDPSAIIEAIARGAEAAGKQRGDDLLLVPDRRLAIGEAVRRARPGDVVLLAGKGHEKTIETSTGEVPWDELAVAQEAVRSRP